MKRRRSYFCPKRFTSRVGVILLIIILLVVVDYYKHTPATYNSAQDRKSNIITGTESTCTTPSPLCSQVSIRCGVSRNNTVQHSILKPPDILILQDLGIFGEIVATSRNEFGTKLLEDEQGNIMTRIREDLRTVEEINREIFRLWLKGEGRQPINWKTIVEVLIEAKIPCLAVTICGRVKPDSFLIPTLPYAHSKPILEAVNALKIKYKKQQVVAFDYYLNTTNEVLFFDLVMKDHGKQKSFQDVIHHIHKHERLLIKGQPGSGKSTMMRHLAKEWAQNKILTFCQILFIIFLGECKDEYHNLSDLLDVQYKDMGIPAKEISLANGNGTCFLLDAFDEKQHKHDLVYDLMHNNELPLSTSILTSRPYDDLMVINRSVEIVGFQQNRLESYLDKLSSNKTANQIVLNLWKDRQVKEMCQLPLHMVMIIFIAQSAHSSSIQTKTQLYTAFMNATIKHYQHNHPEWDTVSLRKCILNKQPGSDDDLCNAFKVIHHVAFKMTFNHIYVFSENTKIRTSIKSLGFVSIIGEDPTRDEVRIVFSHPTFMEFFASLHLVTLSPSEQRYHVQNPVIKNRFGLVKFYFGLLGDFYFHNVSVVSLPLKHYSTAFACPLNKWEHVCPSGYYTAHSSASLELHEEIGWSGKPYGDLLKSAGLVVKSSACISLTNKTINSLHYMLNRASISTLSIIGYSELLRAVTLKVEHHSLNISHLKLLNCLSNFIVCKELHSLITYYHLKIDNLVNDFQYGADLITFLEDLNHYTKAPSFGLTVNDPKLLLSYDIVTYNMRGLNISSIEIHCCYEHTWILSSAFPHIITLYIELLPKCTSESHQQDIRTLSTALKYPRYLQHLIIKPTLGKNVSTLLSGFISLQYLSIEKMYIDGKTADQLITVVSKDLTVLALSHCKLEGLAVKYLTDGLCLLSKLRNLNLYGVDLKDSDVNMLLESIKKLASLSYLGLAKNKLNGEGLKSLVGVLKRIKTFRSLNLFDNPITGRDHIEVLSEMTHLDTLHITVVDDNDKLALFRVVQNLTQLQSFRWSIFDT